MMNDAKHTPQPWHIGWNVTRLDIAGDDGKLIATIQRHDTPLDDARAVLDAQLIRAAPRLRDALERLIGPLDGMQANLDAIREARAALAMANGAPALIAEWSLQEGADSTGRDDTGSSAP